MNILVDRNLEGYAVIRAGILASRRDTNHQALSI